MRVDLLRAWRKHSPATAFGTVWIRFVMRVEYHGSNAIPRNCVCSIVFAAVSSRERSEYKEFCGEFEEFCGEFERELGEFEWKLGEFEWKLGGFERKEWRF